MSPLGFRFTNTLEIDEGCCRTLNANRRFTGAVEREIRPLDITVTAPGDFSAEQVDYIVGGPPCQSFSAAGRRAGGVAGDRRRQGGRSSGTIAGMSSTSGPRPSSLRTCAAYSPRGAGRTSGLSASPLQRWATSCSGAFSTRPTTACRSAGSVSSLSGLRRDLGVKFRFPRPTHGPDSPDGRPYVTAREALADVADETETVPPYGGKYGALLPDIPPGENYRFYTEEMGHPNPQFAWRSKFSNFLYKMDPDDICKTIIAYQGRYDGPFHWHNRKCTLEELKRLQGFPPDFVLPESYAEGVRQIGNSVCPPVARALAHALRAQVEGLESFAVPLMDEGEKLSFDRQKGRRAAATRERRSAGGTAAPGQVSLFEPARPAAERLERESRGLPVRWDYSGGELDIEIGGRADGPAMELELLFSGAVTAKLRRVTARTSGTAPGSLAALWDEIHAAVAEYTSFSSLMPLYGHFTEPHPKFTARFSGGASTPEAEFQRVALQESFRARILPFSAFPLPQEDYEAYFAGMRGLGFDVRTHGTNRTVPEGCFRICYPFTLPSGK